MNKPEVRLEDYWGLIETMFVLYNVDDETLIMRKYTNEAINELFPLC